MNHSGKMTNVAPRQASQRKETTMTLQGAIHLLNSVTTLAQVVALNEKVDAGFVADVPTIQFSDADWLLWSDAVRNKTQSIEADYQPKQVEHPVVAAFEARVSGKSFGFWV